MGLRKALLFGGSVTAGVVFGSAGMHCEAREGYSTEDAMRDNLARRLAKSYADTALRNGDLKVGQPCAFLPVSGTVYPQDCIEDVPCLVTVTHTEPPLEVAFPNGVRHTVEVRDIHKRTLHERLHYWQEADPEMAQGIITLLTLSRQGKIRL